MQTQQPDYFADVELKARKRWDQLESDPELAAPWIQLFRQIQSPQHVISELLQNADDAGATWAKTYIKDQTFYFEHNGKDFDSESFSSLCRFGFSNKRSLHTIGFRGIGFKSVFSLGDEVFLKTQTLAVGFNKQRFTEPYWLSNADTLDRTQIKVKISDLEKKSRMQGYMYEWAADPVSLLFFRNIQQIELQENRLSKRIKSDGPIPSSTWFTLEGNQVHDVLYIQSSPEEFPEEALREIQEERGTSDLDFPPCSVELIWGLETKQRLYVVLPTQVYLEMPFSCNAPFMQDPARNRIKDPSLSPTNRWFLERLTDLATQSLLTWLEAAAMPIQNKVNAYQLLPDSSLDQSFPDDLKCNEILLDGIRQNLIDTRLLLTGENILATSTECLSIPAQLLSIWSKETLFNIFVDKDSSYQYFLAAEVPEKVIKKLEGWGFLNSLTQDEILCHLKAKKLPFPQKTDGLKKLWVYIYSSLEKSRSHFLYSRNSLNHLKTYSIVPDDGENDKKELYLKSELTVIPEKPDILTVNEWLFLTQGIRKVDPTWRGCLDNIRKIKTKRDRNSNNDDIPSEDEIILRVFETLEIHKPCSVKDIVNRNSRRIFRKSEPGEEGIILTRIAVKLNLRAKDIDGTWKFYCLDETWRVLADELIGNLDPKVEEIMPIEWLMSHFIDESVYIGDGSEIRPADWQRFIEDKTLKFIKPVRKDLQPIDGQAKFEEFCRKREGVAPEEYHYKTYHFTIQDFDFDESLWSHWSQCEESFEDVWGRVILALAKTYQGEWDNWQKNKLGNRQSLHEFNPLSLSIKQVSQQKSTARLDSSILSPGWLMKLKSKRCLPDVYKKWHYPSELYLRTPDTDPLQGVESFLHPDYDQPVFRPFLKLLGVQDTPASADKLIARLRTLLKCTKPPLREAYKLYDAIGRVLSRVSDSEREKILSLFEKEALILSEEGKSHCIGDIFQKNDDDIPGVPVISSDFVRLSLWTTLGVPEIATLDLALKWLETLPPEEKLKPGDRQRVRKLLPRVPMRALNVCGCWLSYGSSWTPINKFTWKANTLPQWTTLFPHIKEKVADLSMLIREDQERHVFQRIPSLHDDLKSHIEFSPDNGISSAKPDWLKSLAKGLLRIRNQDLIKTEPDGYSLQARANRLWKTRWQLVSSLKVTPYLKGEPAGDPGSPLVRWDNCVLYSCGAGPQYHQALANELASQFKHNKVRTAISTCIDRSPEWITDYFESNFALTDDVSDGDITKSISSEEDQKHQEGSENIMSEHMTLDWLEEIPSGGYGVDVPTLPKLNRPKTTRVKGHKRTSPSNEDPFLTQYLSRENFQWNESEQCYKNSQGIAIRKTDEILPWIRCAGHRTAVKTFAYYWVGNKSLKEGVEIPAEVWEAMKQSPDIAWLILPNGSRAVQGYKYADLKEKISRKDINLFPAQYRLRKL